MTSLTAIFGSSPDKPEEGEGESEKLLNLYWNRAELKKEFAELRNEQFRLKDRIKEEQGATARLQQKLDHLENLLLDPEWVYSIVTYFQLRGLDLRCQGKLAKFAERLKQQREQRQHNQILAHWNERLSEEAAAMERKIGETRMQVQISEDQLQTERHRLASMSGFIKIFRRRSVTANLDKIAASIESSHRHEQQLLMDLDEIHKRQPPDTQGLDIDTKRLVNFMILSFAQQLYLHFCEDDLASLAKEAGEKSLGATNYGGKASCNSILEQLTMSVETFDQAADFADILKRRATLIAEKAQFSDDEDAVAIADSVSTVFSIDDQGAVSEQDLNLLGENYWNLSGVVSR